MNDRMPSTALNATYPANVSALPDSWISKIFAKFEARYGSLFIDRWKDCNMANVRETWAEELANFEDKPECIGHALKVLATSKFPPTLPEFLEACRQAPRKEAPALRYVPTPEDEERARQAAASAAKVVKKINHDGIDTHWATHPRTVMHLKFIFDAAARDRRFAPCVAEMVRDGICTEDGHLLKFYRDGSWSPVLSRAA
jgi:hypothetical protein